jgi:hypothetical protein
VARHLAHLLHTETVAPEIVGQLGFSGWGEELAPDLLEDVLRAMVDGGHRATALKIVEHRTKAAPANLERWRQLALELVTAPDLIRSNHITNYRWKELALKLVSDFPRKIATAIIREHGDHSTGIWFASEAEEVLHACVGQDPVAVWEALLPELSSKDSANLFSIGFPREVIEQVPQELVLAWIDEQPDERAPIIAKLASKNFSSDDALDARILGTYGDKDDVGTTYFAEYVSGEWQGPASSHWEELASELEDVAQRTKLAKLQRWARKSARDLKRMAERDRQREQEAELRGYQ